MKLRQAGTKPRKGQTMALDNRERTFKLEMQEHYQIVYNFLYRMCGNGADAADLTQETFVRAYVKIDQYESGTNARSWLFRLAKNLFIKESGLLDSINIFLIAVMPLVHTVVQQFLQWMQWFYLLPSS